MTLSDLSHTYLYQLDRLATSFHAVLDQRIRLHTGVGLSQGIILALISQRQPISQQEISAFLDITPGAISRQVEVALQSGWVTAHEDSDDHRKQLLRITPAGQKLVDEGYACIKDISDAILQDKDLETDLMSHITLMQKKIDAVHH